MKRRLFVLAVICALNLADFILTVQGIRSGVMAELNPIMQTAGVAWLKLILAPAFAGVTNITAAQAEKEGSRKTVAAIKLVIAMTLIWLAFVVCQNLSVMAFHTGPIDWIMRGLSS